MVDCVGTDVFIDSETSITRYFYRLSADEKYDFANRLLARLSSPGICDICKGTVATYWLGSKTPEDITAKAISAFRTHLDLAPWQYKGLLSLAGESSVHESRRKEAFDAVIRDDVAFWRRAEAFGETYLLLTDQERIWASAEVRP